MKKLLFGILVICLNQTADAAGEENGNDCESSYTLTTTNSNYQFAEEQLQSYFKFIADETELNLVVEHNTGVNLPITKMTLYVTEDGNCEELDLIEEREIYDVFNTACWTIANLEVDKEYVIVLDKNQEDYPDPTSFIFYIIPSPVRTPCDISAYDFCSDEYTVNGNMNNLTAIPADSIDILGFKKGVVCSWLDVASSCDLFYDGANAYAGMVSGNQVGLLGGFSESMANVLRKSTTAGDTMELSFKYGKEIFSPISINPALIRPTLTPDRIKVYLTTDVVLSGLPDSLINSVLTLASNPNAQLIATVNKNQIVNSYPNLHSYNDTAVIVNGNYNRLVILCENDTQLNLDYAYVVIDDVHLESNPSPYIIPPGQNATWADANFGLGTGVIRDKIIQINGVFTVNQNLTFRDCDLQMAANSRIVVNNSALLTIVDMDGKLNQIRTCAVNDFWDGIFVDGAANADLQIRSNQSTLGPDMNIKISNMKDGIVYTDLTDNNSGSSSIRNVYFDRNERCIKIDNSNINSAPLTENAFIVENCNFDCTVPLVNSSSSYYPSVAIELINFHDIDTSSSRTLGFYLKNTPSLSSIHKLNGRAGGLVSRNSDLTLSRATFENFNNYDGTYPSKRETAIAITNSTSSNQDYTTSIMEHTSFRQCRLAINGTGSMDLFIIRNLVNYGVAVTDYPWQEQSGFLYLTNNKEPVRITYNTIHNVTQGILTEAVTDLEIDNNNFDLERKRAGWGYTVKNNVDGFAIVTRNVNNAAINNDFADTRIHHNTILHAKTGIQAWFTSAEIYDNTITEMNDNFVQGTSCPPFGLCPPPAPAYGIRVTNSENEFIVRSNTIISANRNPKVIGISLENAVSMYGNGSEIKCNKTEAMGVGLQFLGSNDASTLVANNNMKNNYRGLVLVNNGFIGNVGSAGSAGGNQWNWTFGNLIFTHTFADNSYGDSCTIYYNGGLPYNPTILNTDATPGYSSIQKLGAGSAGNVGCSALLRTKPGASNGNSNSVRNNNHTKKMAMGRMGYMKHAVDSAVRLNQQLLYWKLAKDSVLATDSSWRPFADSMKNTALGKAFGKNNRAVSVRANANNFDVNVTVIAAIQQKLKRKQILTTQDSIEVGRIALLCPYYDGIAVYFARDIMLDMGYGIIVNDCEVTQQTPTKPFRRLKSTEESEFIVYPNPATNQLNFNYLVQDVEQIEFLLYDVLGKLQLRTKLLVGDQHRISLTDLNKGVYLYRMTNSAKVLELGKLIIE
jgi:hypothetical protein